MRSFNGPLLAVLAGAALLLAACDDDPLGSETPALLVCTDLAEAITTDVTVTGGEEQRITVGNHVLDLPAGAIPDGVQFQFTIVQVPSQNVELAIDVGSEVQFGADLTLTLSYGDREDCTINGVSVANATSLSIYNLDRGERLPGADAGAQAVAGTTRSFSTFAIAD